MLKLGDFWLLCVLVPTITIGIEIVITAIQKEWFPSLIDIATEIDRGYNTDNKYNSLLSNSFSLPADEALQSNLKYSLILGKLKIPLDWSYITRFYSSIAGTSRANPLFGLHNTENGGYPEASSYNYDHVSTSYGPGAGQLVSTSNGMTYGNSPKVNMYRDTFRFPKVIIENAPSKSLHALSFDDEA